VYNGYIIRKTITKIFYMMNARQFISSVTGLFFLLALTFAIRSHAAFSEPAVAPPNGDAYAPLNTSGTGQTKVGGLVLNTGAATVGLSVPNGRIDIGTVPAGTTVTSALSMAVRAQARCSLLMQMASRLGHESCRRG